MAISETPRVPMGDVPAFDDVAVQRNWRSLRHLSSIAVRIDRMLGEAAFDRGPWTVIVFAAGIASWFLLDTPWQWSAAIALALIAALGSLVPMQGEVGDLAHLRRAVTMAALAFAAGILVIWTRSGVVGAEPIERPRIELIQGHVLERQDQSAQGRVRLTLAVRDASAGIARKYRINVPIDAATPAMAEGAVLRLRVRLMPPAPPMLPGSYDFARVAWFQGLAATGSALGQIEIVEAAPEETRISAVQRALAGHVRERVDGSAGAIAAAFASGDRGGISEADEAAMRDSGLTHLLSISGLHVSAVVAAAWLLAIKLLALWPWLALRVRLPVVAASCGALAGIGYTLLTGAEVPTVRSCAAAILVLIALALGRDALSLRMVAVAGFFVLLLWPESLMGPSFQMSFAAVLAIVTLHTSSRVRAFLAPREQGRLAVFARRGLMLLLTGVVIELTLMPIVLFHFHRAGVYGALANVVAIPLVTFVAMPLIALALVLDIFSLGAPVWWLVERALDLLLTLAHLFSSQPGAVKLMPQMGVGTFALFVAGGLWFALWSGRHRIWGLVPVAIATLSLMFTPVPDVLISRDGQQVGVTTGDGRLLSLRQGRSSYAAGNLMELAGVESEPIALAEWPGARCSRDFCVLTIERGERIWTLLMARSRELVEERALAAACEQVDIVIAPRWLPASCRPHWLKADGRLLGQAGGLALYLQDEWIDSVASSQGEHGWWRTSQH
ncbi:MAG: metal-binding protein [Erythrobacter sp.]|nr:metal-binding protein [Erythrobacter sp.]